MNEIEAGQICDSTFSAIYHGTGQLSNVPGLIKRIIREKAWARRKVKMHGTVELASLRELITKPPMVGWGEDPAKIEALIRDDVDALAMWREAMKLEPGTRTDLRDNVTEVEIERGNSRAYTVARLQRERPDLFERVKAKELSANAAAIEAGFRRVNAPLDRLKSAWRKASDEERAAFIAWAGEHE